MERARQSRYHSGMTKTPKRPRDPNQLAKYIVDLATAEQSPVPESKKATAGRAGGKIGGSARAAALTAESRSEIAKRAAAARWKKARLRTH